MTRTLLLALALAAAPTFAAPRSVVPLVLASGSEVAAFDITSLPTMAADGGFEQPRVELPKGIANPDDNAIGFVLFLVAAAQNGKWGLFVSFLIFGLTWLVRKLPKIFPKLSDSKFSEALNSKWGGWITNLLLSLSGGIGTLFFTGIPISVASVVTVIVGAVTYTFTAAGLVEFVKDLTKKRNDEATEAGMAAAGGVNTLDDAEEVLKKGPPPA